MSRIPFVSALLIGMCFFPNGCIRNGNGVKTSKPQVVVIFSDVTSSLIESENNQVATLTADVLDGLAPGTEYYVFPIQMEPERLQPIVHDTVTAEKNFAVDQELKKQRRASLSKAISDLYRLIKPVKAVRTAYGSPDNHSCILYTLVFSDNFFRQFDATTWNRELIYISDMVEECNKTPLNQPISLAAVDISSQLKLAQNAQMSLQLSSVRISVIIPVTQDTYVVTSRPPVNELRAFWDNIFLKCGFQPEDLRSEQKYYFSSGLPARFQPTTNQ